jgi:hypothetical protein
VVRRGVGLLLAAGLAVGTVGPLGTVGTGGGPGSSYRSAEAAPVAEHSLRDLDAACAEAPTSGFRDVRTDDVHRAGIDCIAWWDVAGGFGDGTYRPGQAVTRGQMATFVSTAVLAAGASLPPPGGRFADSVGTHQRGIERLAAAGVVGGFDDGTFRPGQPVTRGQMATFLASAAAHVLRTPLPDEGVTFPDVEGTTHELAIRRIASAGITSGDRDGAYRPGDPVTRGQLGSFVARLLAVLVDEGIPVRAAAAAVDRAAMEAEVCPRTSRDVAIADRLLEGYYRWSPHPEVRLGTDLTWREDPLGDANWRFQFHALRWLWPLLSATETTGDPRYLEHAVALAQDWVADNPPAAPAAGVAWDDHAAAWRAKVFTCIAMQLPSAPGWLAGSLDLHLRMLADPSFYVIDKGNHALNQDIGMLSIACVTGAWHHRDLAVERIAAMVEGGVDHQGVMDEQAVEYQDYNYERYLAAKVVLDACGIDGPGVLDRIPLMPEVLAHLTLPDGTYETLGDTDRRRAKAFEHPATLWMHSRGERGEPPARTFVTYDAGFVVARSGWGTQRPFGEDTFLSGRFGPRPVLHGHDDHGSLTLYAQGQRLLTDPGKYAYANDAERRYVRSREAHNLVTVGAGCVIPNQRSNISGVTSDAVADRFVLSVRVCQGMTWDRHVAFLREGGEVVVVDEVSAPAGTPIAQRWQLEVGAEVAGTPDRVRVNWAGGSTLLIEQLGAVDGVTSVAGGRSPLRGWVSLRYGDLTPAPNLAYTAPASGNATRFVTVLRPGAGGASLPSTAAGSDGTVRVTVPTAGGDEVTIRFPR